MLAYSSIAQHPDYAVSTDGRVLCKTTQWHLSLIAGHKHRRYAGVADTTSYFKVRIAGKRHNVHRLMAEAFIPNPLHLPVVNHIDNDSTNNRVENLEWVSFSQNSTRARKFRTIKRRITSQYKGASKRRYGWACRFKGRSIYGFKTEREAAEHYNGLALSADPYAIVNVFSN